MVNADIAYFFTTVRGFPTTFSGLLFSFEGISAILLSIPFGILSDRYGRKKFVIMGNVLISLSVLIIAISEIQLVLYSTAALLGLADAALTASMGAMLADYSSDENRTLTFSISSFANAAAFGLGGLLLAFNVPLLNIGFSELQAHVSLYLALALSSLASAPLLMKLPEKRLKLNGLKDKELRFISDSTLRIVMKYTTANIFVALGAGLFVPLMSQWFKFKYNVSDILSGPVLGISSILVAVAQLIAPALSKRFGLVRAIVITQAMSTIFMILTTLPPYFILSAFFYIIRTFMMNASNPLSNSLLMGLVNENERGLASSITAIFWRIPNAISTFIGSYLMEIGLLDLPFYIATVLYSISIYMFWYWFRVFETKK